MNPNLIFLFVFSFSVNAEANTQWTELKFYEALRTDLNDYSQKNPPQGNENYWIYSFPSNKPLKDGSKPWAQDHKTWAESN